MYHTYAWRAQGSTADLAEMSNKAKERTDLDLAKQGMIPVPYTGNPDTWILQETTPYSVTLEFRDAHTGQTYWKGESRLSSTNGIPSEKTVNSAVDALVNHYIADEEWKNGSWWFSSSIKRG
jgi:hypothetical protein